MQLHEDFLYLACMVECEVGVDAHIFWDDLVEIVLDAPISLVVFASELTAQLND